MVDKLSDQQKAEYMKEFSLTEDKMEMYMDIFSIMDADGDGLIGAEELCALFQSFGLESNEYFTERQLEKSLTKTGDPGRSGFDFHEFLSNVCNDWAKSVPYIVVKKFYSCKQRNRAEFRRNFDKDGDGFFSADDLRQSVADYGRTLTDEECEKLIEEMDVDNDGRVDYRDFVAFTKNFRKKFFNDTIFPK